MISRRKRGFEVVYCMSVREAKLKREKKRMNELNVQTKHHLGTKIDRIKKFIFCKGSYIFLLFWSPDATNVKREENVFKNGCIFPLSLSSLFSPSPSQVTS